MKFKSTPFFKRPSSVIFTGIVLSVIIMAQHMVFLENMALKTIDLRFQTRGRVHVDDRVVIAAIDEKSLSKEGKWMWPRSRIAQLIMRLSRAGAKVITLDLVFSEPDTNNIKDYIADIQKRLRQYQVQSPEISKYLNTLLIDSDHDQILADTIQTASAQIVTGFFLEMEKGPASHIPPEKQSTTLNLIQPAACRVLTYESAEAFDFPFLKAFGATTNIALISRVSKHSGFFNSFPDIDGTIRTAPVVVKLGNELYTSLAVQTVATFLNTSPRGKIGQRGMTDFSLGRDLHLPIDPQGKLFINYRGEAKSFQYISATDILHDQMPTNAVKNKIVILGATATGIFDVVTTPFNATYPGPEIHATLIDMILNHDFIFRPEWDAAVTLLTMICLAVILGLLLCDVGAIKGFFIFILASGVYILACQYAFSVFGCILNMIYPLMTLLTIYVLMSIHTFLTVTRQKQFIRNAFSTYLSPVVVRELEKNPESLSLGGEKRQITAFFSDVASFTRISETLSPEALVKLLNEFLTEMTDIIMDYGGTVDKFEGDAIIAFFGAPTAIAEQEKTAAQVAVAMQDRLAQLRKQWKAQNQPPLFMRIGMATGDAVVGNMGSKNRMDYTMMGDTVNTASRLEGANKVYGCQVLACESTFTKATSDGTIYGREIDRIQVVGKTIPLRIYEFMGMASTLSSSTQKMAEFYTQGLYAMYSGNWERAIICFKNALKEVPNDGPSQSMLKRCSIYQKAPPPEWNGVFVLNTK